MYRYYWLFAFLIIIPGAIYGQSTAIDSIAVRQLLNDFLSGASENSIQAHERMWSERLIYTGSNGVRRGKAEILHSVKEAGPVDSKERIIYEADQIQMLLFGESIVVAFRLVATYPSGEQRFFLNTGTFIREENGVWKAVAWQATIKHAG